MKIITLTLTKIGEKDALVNAISEDSYLTFKAHGVLNPTNKNTAINNPLGIFDAVISNNKTGSKSLKEISVISLLDYSRNDLFFLTAFHTILEATNKMLSEEEKHLAFPYLEKTLLELKEAKYPILNLIAYLAKLIKLSGVSFEINHCVGCGSKKDIVAFSFIDGGYICSHCQDDTVDLSLTTYQLMMIRSLCGTVDFNFNNFTYEEGEILILLKKFVNYIEDGIGVYLDSPNLILKN